MTAPTKAGLTAGILAVGSELLDPLRRETNALHITRRLREIGVDVALRAVVADDHDQLEGAFKAALGRCDVVIATGGLGPTEDDLTREAAAAALGSRLRRDETLVSELKARFAQYGRVMAPVNERQADVIEGAVALRNRRGTAPGQRVDANGHLLFLLPGPPGEMEPMFEEHVLPLIRERAGDWVLVTRVLKIASMAESDVEQLVAPVYKTYANPRTTILGSPGQVELHLTGGGSSREEAEGRVLELATRLRDCLPGRVYSDDGRELHEVVAALLVERRLKLALAESCTAGAIAARLTEVPGASAFLDRGYVTYSNRSKQELLGVKSQVLETAGAVSEEAARDMAEGVRRAAETDLGLAVTGIAGPSGGTPEKPVGLVFLALSGVLGDRVRRVHFPGERQRVRIQACQAALEMLRRALLELPPL